MTATQAARDRYTRVSNVEEEEEDSPSCFSLEEEAVFSTILRHIVPSMKI